MRTRSDARPFRNSPIAARAAVILVGGSALLAGLLGLASAYSDGPPPAHTGGFGEPTCHQCHFDGPINDGAHQLQLTTATRYQPGHSYPVIVRFERRDLSRGGFELAARFAGSPAAGRQAGILRAEDARVTVTSAPDSAPVAYAHHTAAGSRPGEGGFLTWTLTWVAPDEARGPVIFHVAANAANDDDSAFGDHIYTDSVVVPPASDRRAGPVMWWPQQSGTDAELRGMSAAGWSVIWASGRGGTFARSVDGGFRWSTGTVPGAAELFLIDVHAVSADTACVLGTHFDGGLAAIYRTTDAGRSWVEGYRSEGEGVFFDGMAFWDANHGVAFSDPVDGAFLIVTTEDGGASWRRVPPENTPPPLAGEAGFAASGTAITVEGAAEAWFGTGGASVARVLHTGDGGRTWSAAETPLPAGPTAGVFGIAFRDSLNGVAVGGDYRAPDDTTANVARTSDGGRSWTLLGSSAPAGVRYGVAYVGEPGANPTLLAVGPSGWGYSPDDGASWVVIDTAGFNTVAAGPGGRAWVGGVGGRIAHLRLMGH